MKKNTMKKEEKNQGQNQPTDESTEGLRGNFCKGVSRCGHQHRGRSGNNPGRRRGQGGRRS